MKPDEILQQMAEMFRERHEIYGDNYLMIGDVMEVLFPTGLVLTTIEEWNRFYLFIMIIVKISRLACTNLDHKDSVRDIGVYAAMLESLFEETK